MTDTAPVQRDDAWLEASTAEQIVAARQQGELHTLMGGRLDAEGWPVGPNGKRLTIGSSS